MASTTMTGTRSTSTARSAATGWNLPLAVVVSTIPAYLVATFAFSGYEVGQEMVMALVLAIPGLAFSALAARKSRPWMYLAAGLTAPLFPVLVLFVFGAIGSLGGGSPLEFGVASVLLGALVLSVTAGVTAFRASRAAIAPGRGIGNVALAVGGLVAGAFLAGLVAQAGAGTVGGGYDVAPEATAAVTMREFQFAVDDAIPAGKLTELVIANEDGASHTFTYEKDGRTYSHHVPGHATAKVLVLFDQPGTVRFWCEPHPGMEGALAVA